MLGSFFLHCAPTGMKISLVLQGSCRSLETLQTLEFQNFVFGTLKVLSLLQTLKNPPFSIFNKHRRNIKLRKDGEHLLLGRSFPATESLHFGTH